MPSPFPGMDPYLEHPELWAGVHHWLITMMAEELVPQLRPKYRVAIEVRMMQSVGDSAVLVGIPDVAVRQVTSAAQNQPVAVAVPPTTPLSVTVPMPEVVKQGYLEIREVATGAVVTAIEVLSPVNKRGGEGRRAYEAKRLQVLGSGTHLVEIDLLRAGSELPLLQGNVQSHYRVLVSRSDRRPQADLYAFNLQQPLPQLPLPLAPGDAEPILSLKTLLDRVYDRGGYDLVVDYGQSPPPPEFTEAERIWLAAQLASATEALPLDPPPH
ncbi:MAG: DUF4058 family protein [Leptolyngbya sp. RL_3_1]|nr:DUF4058 family protein [Leptolyngbya sp. RL_3_1]